MSTDSAKDTVLDLSTTRDTIRETYQQIVLLSSPVKVTLRRRHFHLLRVGTEIVRHSFRVSQGR